MEYFKKHFIDTDFTTPNAQGEVKVVCPFHDDNNPSASVNTEKSLFKCWVCGSGYNEIDFIKEIEGIGNREAHELLGEMEKHTFNEWDYIYKAELWADRELLQKVEDMGLSHNTIEELKLGKGSNGTTDTLAFPVFFKGSLMDTKNYNIYGEKGVPKWTSNPSAKRGWLIPYDLWLEQNPRETFIMEGEKDMAIAREVGLDAICITGGAGTLPNQFVKKSMKDKEFVICYDNDDAGRAGALKLADELYGYVSKVSLLDMSKLVSQDKGDFYDFIKGGGDVFEFLIQPRVEYKPEETEEDIELFTITQALGTDRIYKRTNSEITITGEFADNYSVYTFLKGTKETIDNDGTMAQGEVKTWALEDWRINDILNLIEVDAKSNQLQKVYYNLLDIPAKETGVKIDKKEPIVVYRSVASDVKQDGSNVSIDLYSFEKLKVGEQYSLEYTLYPHPTKNQQIVGIAHSVIDLGDNTNFQIDKEQLSSFRTEGTIKERVDKIYESTKHYVAKHMDFNIWFLTDLVFNSILDFYYTEESKPMRGALDVFILGDTQVGKSETTSKLTSLYEFGHFLSLKTSTTVGLIGGSNKVEGSYLNTIGAIPRQHKKLAVLEEFSGAKPDFIKTMTDIRSSNEIRISRVSGELIAPCKLRMITISNPINDENGKPRNISSFPNGVVPILELVKSAEDVTRYDGFILAPKPEKTINPFSLKLVGEPIDEEHYKHKIKWVETRKPENVIFEDDVKSYIWEKGQELNEMFESDITIFGVTTHQKLARFSVALASLIMNVDDTFENIIVTKEIVDFMVDWLIQNYSSKYFRLNDVRKQWVRFTHYTKEDLEELQEIYDSQTTLVNNLANSASSTRGNLQSVSGLNVDGFSQVFERLVRLNCVDLRGNTTVYPTEKFRKMYRQLDLESKELPHKYTKKESKVIFDLEERK